MKNKKTTAFGAAMVAAAMFLSACSTVEDAITDGDKAGDDAAAGVAEQSSEPDNASEESAEPAGGSSDTLAVDPVGTAPVPLEVRLNGEVVSAEDGTVQGEIVEQSQTVTYTFSVEDKQDILIQELGGCTVGDNDIDYEFDGPISGTGDFDTTFDECLDIEEDVADSSGTVKLVMGDDSPSTSATGDYPSGTGIYRFRVVAINVPETIKIALDEKVGPDVPVVGAGRIEDLGQVDKYVFDVTIGKAYALTGLGGCELQEGSRLWFDLEGAVSGYEGFREKTDTEDCTETFIFEADKTGTALIVVEGDDRRTTGTYSFVVSETDAVGGETETAPRDDAEDASDDAMEDAES